MGEAVKLIVLVLFAGLLQGESALKIIRSKCLSCHGEKAAGGLRMDTVDNMVRGGKHGPAVTPGDSEASPILSRHYFTEKEQAVVKRWIAAGAMQYSMGGQEP